MIPQIYETFRRGLVESGGSNRKRKMYSHPTAQPCRRPPEPASTVHCYFLHLLVLNLGIADTRSNEVYSATEDLYDAQRDPDENGLS